MKPAVYWQVNNGEIQAREFSSLPAAIDFAKLIVEVIYIDRKIGVKVKDENGKIVFEYVKYKR